MKGKKFFRSMLSSALLICFLSGAVAYGHPAQAIMEFYAADLKEMDTLEPYIVSILALNEVEHDRHLPAVKQFIQWYFSKLNYPDNNGLTGTIYVYSLVNGREYSTDKYDSVDGYSGLFLHLLYRYVIKTGDIELLRDHWRQIEDIAYTIPLLQDKDGLTMALPGRKVKYLMDNCEAYGGLAAYLELRKLVGKGDSPYYNEVRAALREGIRTQLYDPANLTLAWAIENQTKTHSSWDNYYPDAYAQLFPIYYDVYADDPAVRNNLWGGFIRRYGRTVGSMPIEQRIMYKLTKTKMGELLQNGQ